jgi:hypothetical protein
MTVYDKTKKYEGMTFFKRPKNTLYYLYLDGVNAATLLIYDLICDYYNNEKGYAYPSQDRLAADTAMRRETIGKHIKALAKYNLIEIYVNKGSSKKKYAYKPKMPLSREELFGRYPKARQKYEKAKEMLEERYEPVVNYDNLEDLF